MRLVTLGTTPPFGQTAVARHLDAPLALVHPTETGFREHPRTNLVPTLTRYQMEHCVMGSELFAVEVSNPTRRPRHCSDPPFRPNKIPKIQNSTHHLHPDRPKWGRTGLALWTDPCRPYPLQLRIREDANGNGLIQFHGRRH